MHVASALVFLKYITVKKGMIKMQRGKYTAVAKPKIEGKTPCWSRACFYAICFERFKNCFE